MNHARVVATVFALAAFAVALVAGLAAGNDAAAVITRAVIALVACQIVGMLAGTLVEKVLTEHEARYRAEHPVPSLLASAKDDDVVVVDEAVEQPVDESNA